MKRFFIWVLLFTLFLTSCDKIRHQDGLDCIEGEVNHEIECPSLTFDIEFVTNSDTQITSIEVLYGETISLPETPTKEGFNFEGWYIDDTFYIAFDEEKPVIDSHTLYAKWTSTLSKDIEVFLYDEQFNGMILLNMEGENILTKGYGYADTEQLIENSESTVFHIGSITKQFTAASIMLLQEQGLLNVNHSVSQYIDDIPNGDEITIHHLLIHSSGLHEYTNLINWSDEEYLSSYQSPEILIQLIQDKNSLFNPGDEFSYCNTNYLLLGFIIENVSGLTYGEFLNQNLFIPLNMSDSETYDMNYNQKYALGYEDIIENKGIEINKYHNSIPYAAGNIASTTIDLFKWHIALVNNTILSKESTDRMFEHYINAGYGGYGYGWVIIEDGEYPVMEHAGFINGFRSYIYRNLDNDSILILLTNVEINNIYIVADEIIEMMSLKYHIE